VTTRPLRLSPTALDYHQLFTEYARHDERGLLLIGPGRVILELNPAARSMLGYDGEGPQPVSLVTHDMNVEFAIGQAFHDRHPVEYESYVPDPDRLLRFRIQPILDSNGEPVLAISTIEDRTRLRYLETVRRDFVANVSHELRTPLASIRLLGETLREGAIHDEAAAAHFLHRIEVEVDAMAGLVEELLELSRLESGSLRLEEEPTDVQKLLSDVCNRLAPMAKEKDVHLALDVQEGLPSVLADPRRIEQVLMNLAHNGIKFTPSGGEVTLRARSQRPGVLIEVSDTGVGMSASEAARVFERFYKLDAGRKRDAGAGLGLAISRHLIELHGSRLQAVSEVGRGSRFSFTLPVAG
jgi:two-component system, OmpR family, phosphate regulon sensor histidine kinase PhoR